MRKSGSVRPEIDLSDNLQENTDYETGCTRNGLREGESTGTVFLRLLEVRGPRRSLSPPHQQVYRVERMRVGRAGFNDQDAITLNGKKL